MGLPVILPGIVIVLILVHYLGVYRALQRNGKARKFHQTSAGALSALKDYTALCRSQGVFPIWTVVMIILLASFAVVVFGYVV
jgi:hypothetical protein